MERDTHGIGFTLEVTEYFIHQLSEADRLMRACDSRCTEAPKTQLPSFNIRIINNFVVDYAFIYGP
jgi:hypothetical protein